MAKIYMTDGRILDCKPVNNEHFSALELNTVVGGYFEFIYLNNGIMVVNEEGLSLNLPKNHLASALIGRLIVGNVLVCEKDQIK